MKIIVTDLRKCLGCHSCELACAISRSTSKTLLGAILEDPKPATRVRVVGIGTQPVPLQCQQCEDAPCAAVCPTAALYRLGKDETVLFKRVLCIGCSSCVLVCPFGAIRRADGGVMAKCSLVGTGSPKASSRPALRRARRRRANWWTPNVVAEDKLHNTALAITSLETRTVEKKGG